MSGADSWKDVELGEIDLHLFNEGTHCRAYEKFGSHPCSLKGRSGAHFSVWAPNAERVSVVGNFNHWDPQRTPLAPLAGSGIWNGFVPDLGEGTIYKYHIVSKHGGYRADKADPFGIASEVAPKTASVVWSLDYAWGDQSWMEQRARSNAINGPISIYEVHLGSWMRVPEAGYHSLSYRELAPRLAAHVKRIGYTHVELMPVMEHPLFASWGYQVTGYFSATSRYGTPQDLMFLIDYLHQQGIGVILDWVPAHFPSDGFSLGYFDGTYLYEHADVRQRVHPEWTSLIFNYGRNEVRSFLLSSAIFWLDKYHADGLRVDGVSSMLYLDYGRSEGEWIPNRYGGHENIEAVDFLRQLNHTVHQLYPGVLTIAEESTAWPRVSGTIEEGGLGFDMKWDMGWMHDTLRYLQRDSLYRSYHHGELTFRSVYALSERYILPLSHDEVVHGKGSLFGKMFGDEWQKYAQLRLLYAYMFAEPGKKLTFMGDELGQRSEWNHDGSIDWHLQNEPLPSGIGKLLTRLHEVYRAHPALYEQDFERQGFDWIEAHDSSHSLLAFIRRARDGSQVVCVFNFLPTPIYNYRLGVDFSGTWRELVNTDAVEYGGSGQGNLGEVNASPVHSHARLQSLQLTVPPHGALLLAPVALAGPRLAKES